MRIPCVVLMLLIACGPPTKTGPTNTTTKPPSGDVAAKPPSFKIDVVARRVGGPAVEGVIRDAQTKEPLAGATVIMTSPALTGEQAVITDEKGMFSLSSLPPGKYVLRTYYLDLTAEAELEVADDKLVKVSLDIDQSQVRKNDVITIQTEPPPSFKTAKEALEKGAVEEATRLGELELAKKASSRLHGMLAIARYGAAVEILMRDGMRGDPDQSRVAGLKKALNAFLADLDRVQASLEAAAKDPGFSLELCVACMASSDGYLRVLPPGSLDIERDRAGQPLPENDPRRRPTFRFDHGDLAWGRAMISFQQAFVNIVLAYDWDWLERMIMDSGDQKPEATVTVKLLEPARIAKARELILAGLAFSDEARVAYTKETDDDREWVPSPKQKNYASPLAVDDNLYKTWATIVGDVRSLVSGETGVSFVALGDLLKIKGAPAGFIDFGAMLKSPKDIVWELGALDKIETEKNANTRKALTTKVLKGLLGNGYKATMKPSRITDRLLQLRKDLDKQGGDQIVEDKLKYFIWFN
jgi:hypothetical protein